MKPINNPKTPKNSYLIKELHSFLSKYYGLIVSFLLSLAFTHAFFKARMLYNDAAILRIDYPRFAFLSWYIGEFLWPQFHSFFGFTNLVFIGMPVVHIYPIGFLYLVWFLTFFNISYAVSLKIWLFVIMVGTGMLPAILLSKISRPFPQIAASLFMWAGLNSIWLNIVTYGMIPFLLAVDLSVIFLYRNHIEKKFRKKEKLVVLFRKPSFFIDVFLLSAIVLINYMATIMIAFIISVDLIFSFIIFKKVDKKTVFLIIFYYVLLILYTLLLIAFWIIPTVLIQFKHVVFNTSTYVFSFENSINSIDLYGKNNFYTLIPGVALAIYYRFKGLSRSYIENFSFLLIFGGLFFAFIVPFFHIPTFLGINSTRYLIFLEIGLSMTVGRFVERTIPLFSSFNIRTIQEKIRSLFTKSHSPSRSLKSSRALKKKQIASALILFLLFMDLTPIPLSGMTYRWPLLGKFQNYERQYIYEDINYTQWLPEDLELIQWIKENTDKNSRILMQISGDESGLYISHGHTMSYFAEVTDRYYATGHLDHFWYEYSKNCTFIDDYLYGFHLLSLPSEINQTLILYNVEYIIVYTNLAKLLFRSYSLHHYMLHFITALKKYWIFKLDLAPRTYFFIEKENPNYNENESVRETTPLKREIIQPVYPMNVSMTGTSTVAYFNSSVENQVITFSLHDFDNWNVYINGIKVEKLTNPLGLIAFKMPEMDSASNALIKVEIRWETTKIEKISTMVSLSAFISLILILVILFSRHRISFRFARRTFRQPHE